MSAEQNKQSFTDLYRQAYRGNFEPALELIAAEFASANFDQALTAAYKEAAAEHRLPQ